MSGPDREPSAPSFERVHHLALLDLGLVTRLVEDVFGSIRG